MQDQQQRRSLDFRFLAEPTDINFAGKVFNCLYEVDGSGRLCLCSTHYCVTVSMGSIRFVRAIVVGQIVTITTQIVHTGKTSTHI